MYNEHVPVNRIFYLLFVARYLSFLFIYFVHCSIFILSLFDSIVSLFIVQRKDSFLFLYHIPGISILLYLFYKNTNTVYASQ